jgi:uncharacterized cupin superfamily protein
MADRDQLPGNAAQPMLLQRKVASLARLGEAWTHPLEATARRRGASLGDTAGLTLVGVHLCVVAPGDATTALHRHDFSDEFVYIIAGEATVTLDDVTEPVAAGDFIAFPARGPAHMMRNTGQTDLVYLVGGNRPSFDVCDYPSAHKRMYVAQGPQGRRRQVVDIDER